MAEILTFDGLIKTRMLMSPSTTPVFVSEEGVEVFAPEFDRLTGCAAEWLLSQGVCKGDRVAIWLPNCTSWLALLFGAARIGAVVAAVNTRYRTAELHHILHSARAKMLIFENGDSHANFHAMVDALDFTTLPNLSSLAAIDAASLPDIQGIPVKKCAFEHLNPLPPQGAKPSDPVLLFTTSGTTSKPKLVVHTQSSLSLHARNCAQTYGFDQTGAQYLAAMPFCGVFGLNPTFAAFVGGAPIHMMASFKVEPAIEATKVHKITHFFGSDEMFRQMWQADPAAMRHARLCGYASFTPGLGAQLRDMVNAGLPLAGLYGASEVNAIFSIQPLDLGVDQQLQGGGRPAGGASVSVRVRDAETGALCADGKTGLLEIRAPTNFAGYFENPEANAIDDEGYFRSGDIGYLRGDDTFVYLARGGDFIRLSGFLTDPAEIEEVIEQAEDVAKAQVVGVTHAGKTRPVAFILAKDGSTPDRDAILTMTKSRLAHYKVPLVILEVAAFPATESANGLKIQKTKLREMAETHLAGETA